MRVQTMKTIEPPPNNKEEKKEIPFLVVGREFGRAVRLSMTAQENEWSGTKEGSGNDHRKLLEKGKGSLKPGALIIQKGATHA